MSQPPILIGPGHKQSSVRAAWRSASNAGRAPPTPASLTPVCLARPHWVQFVQLCSLAPPEDTAGEPTGIQPEANPPPIAGVETNARPEAGSLSINVFTRSVQQPLRLQKTVGNEAEVSSANVSDTEWALGGLEKDQNFMVQALACVAAVPLGVWEQTVGSLFKRSRENADKVTASLNGFVARGHFEQDLADEVARKLQAGLVDPVRRSDEPLHFALARLGEETGLKFKVPDPKADCTTALEIQVTGARLVGKKPKASSRALSVEIQATVFRTSDGQELYSCPIRYLSTERKLKDWTASDALLFRRELEACTKEAAAALAADLTAKNLANPARP